MSNVKDIIAGIRSVDNNQDMRDIIDAVNDQQKQIARMSSRKFSVGDYVYFKNKQGEVISGPVIKVNPSTVKVQVGMVKWTVNAGLLTLDEMQEVV